jgi:hypothetical protein
MNGWVVAWTGQSVKVSKRMNELIKYSMNVVERNAWKAFKNIIEKFAWKLLR